MEELNALREQIDGLDRQLAALFEERMEVCRRVGAYKAAHGLPVLDARREREVLASKPALLRDKSLTPELLAFFEAVMAASRQLQERRLLEDSLQLAKRNERGPGDDITVMVARIILA